MIRKMPVLGLDPGMAAVFPKNHAQSKNNKAQSVQRGRIALYLTN
jgi:hypothetical protein